MTFELPNVSLDEEGENGSKPFSTFITEIIFYSILAYVFSLAVTAFSSTASYVRSRSAILFVFHTIFLYMHEGGHFLFSFFGRTLYVLGGSFWQVVLPLLPFILAVVQRSRIAPFPLILTGMSLMDVSVYIGDAPYRALPLITHDKSGHDWHNLLRDWDMMDSASTLADCAYYLGVLCCIVGVLGGFFLAFTAYFRPTTAADVKLQSSLNQTLNKQKAAGKENDFHN